VKGIYNNIIITTTVTKGWVAAKDQIIVRICAAMTFRTQRATSVVMLAWQAILSRRALTSGLPKIRQPAVFVLPCHGWTVGVTATHATKMQIRK